MYIHTIHIIYIACTYIYIYIAHTVYIVCVYILYTAISAVCKTSVLTSCDRWWCVPTTARRSVVCTITSTNSVDGLGFAKSGWSCSHVHCSIQNSIIMLVR